MAEDKKEENQAVAKQEQPKQSMTLMDTPTTDFMNPAIYIQMKSMANDFVKSHAIPKGYQNAEQVLVAFQMGYELGLKPMEALNSLYPVNGQLNLWGKATVKRLRDHGWQISYDESVEDQVTATVTKRSPIDTNVESYTETYKFSDAVESGYTKDNYGKEKVGWRKGVNRRLKLRYGVLSMIIKSYLPEVLGAVGDIVEVAQDYEIIDVPAAKSNKDRMAAAEAERGKMSKNFAPKATSPVEPGE